MNFFLAALNVPGFCLGLLSCFILLIANQRRELTDYLVLVLITGFTLVTLQDILVSSGYILRVPHLFRAFSPVYYLMIPTVYLYVRVTLNGERKFRRMDVLHLLPAIFHLIELMPWYLHDGSYKHQWLSHSLADPDFVLQLREGILPPYFHNIIRSVLALGYLVAILHLWWTHPSAGKQIKKRFYCGASWRPQVLFLLLVLVPVNVAVVLFVPTGMLDRSSSISIVVASTFFVIMGILFSKPDVLYGILPIEFPAPVFTEAPVIEFPVIDQLKSYQPILETTLLSKPFLKHGYSLSDLCRDSGIPRHHLSALLNKVYGLKFNDFINENRIKHISCNFSNPAWSNLTIEGIATEAGFNSRTTFFNAIKKSTGMSPKEFLQRSKMK